MMPADPVGFQLFSISHIAGLVAIGFVTAALVRVCRVPRCRPWNTRIAVGFAVLIAAIEIVWYVSEARKHGLSVHYSLPFHLCDFSMIAAIFALLTRKQVLYEFAYFFGFGGATQALITPELQEGFPAFECMKFFASHGSILTAVIFLTFVFGMRPMPRSIPRMVIAGTLYMLLVGAFDWATGANYGFLREKPYTPTLLDHLGPWPWYLGSLWLIGFALIFILYAPFFIADRLRARHANTASVG
jgi:hypothetical integral membrane protein (TIGR02206 family)